MYKTTITPNNKEINVEIDFEYQPEEPMSKDREYPGCDAELTIISVMHDDFDIIDYLTPKLIEDLERKMLKNIKDIDQW